MHRFDVTLGKSGVSIDYHVCREEADNNHGYSFDEAKKVVIGLIEEELEVWQAMSFENWRRNYHPTEKEIDEDMAMEEDLLALREEAQLSAQNEQ